MANISKTYVVGFGSSKASLTTVGYALVNANGTTAAARSTTGVVNLGGGWYGIPVTHDVGFTGWIVYDSGEGTPRIVADPISPVSAQTVRYAVETGITDLQALSAILAATTGKITGQSSSAPVIYAPDGTTPRISATTDLYGDRTSVTLTLPAS